jgi:hypothetical protein
MLGENEFSSYEKRRKLTAFGKRDNRRRRQLSRNATVKSIEINRCENSLPLTHHAAARCRQRGIRTEVVNFVMANFDCDHYAGDGATAISISRRLLAELEVQGASSNLIDQASRTVLIVGEDGGIVTAINRPTWFARFHYGADRRSHRRHRRHRSHRRRRRSLLRGR